MLTASSFKASLLGSVPYSWRGRLRGERTASITALDMEFVVWLHILQLRTLHAAANEVIANEVI